MLLIMATTVFDRSLLQVLVSKLTYCIPSTYIHSNIASLLLIGYVTTLAGRTEIGSQDGLGSNALFSGPGSISLASTGDLYALDTNTGDIRIIKSVYE